MTTFEATDSKTSSGTRAGRLFVLEFSGGRIHSMNSDGSNHKTKMRSFIFAVAAIVTASWATDQAEAADQMPAFNIVRNCSAEVASAGVEKVADCAKDETDAKNELDKRWSKFGASNKQACVGESSIGAGQSYVELLTCLEMSSGEFSAGEHQFQ